MIWVTAIIRSVPQFVIYFLKQQVWEEALKEYLPWLKPGSGVFKGGRARVVVHKISDSLSGVLHLPARGQGVLLDHPATGRGQWARSQPEGPRPGDETNTPPRHPVDLKPWMQKQNPAPAYSHAKVESSSSEDPKGMFSDCLQPLESNPEFCLEGLNWPIWIFNLL